MRVALPGAARRGSSDHCQSPNTMAWVGTGLLAGGLDVAVRDARALLLGRDLGRLRCAARTALHFSITPRERTTTSGLSTMRPSGLFMLKSKRSFCV